ncbi:hypothetical protein HNR16_001693 [Pseudoclavibacter chungangensis]|nr:hypothetical protein [Pseudoclavibacter chungangensis]
MTDPDARTPESGTPTNRFDSTSVPHATPTTAVTSPSTAARGRPTTTATTTIALTSSTGRVRIADQTPSAVKSWSPSCAAMSVPGASEPQGTSTSPSSPATTAFTGVSPILMSRGAVTTTPRPKPVTDSMNGVSPNTSSSRVIVRSPPASADASHDDSRSCAPLRSIVSAIATPPSRMSATTSSVGPISAVVAATTSAPTGKRSVAPTSATTSPATAAQSEGTRRSSIARITTIGAAATSNDSVCTGLPPVRPALANRPGPPRGRVSGATWLSPTDSMSATDRAGVAGTVSRVPPGRSRRRS